MKKGLTELVFILDKSGSMAGMESDTIGGFNSMLEKQKKEECEAYVSTFLFNDHIKLVHDRTDLRNVRNMTREDYTVGGCTALLDAVGKAIQHIRSIHRYAREEDRPESTLFVITTDGLENASHQFSRRDVKGMIEQQKSLGWQFIFLGANIDSEEAASEIGIENDHAFLYKLSNKGIHASLDAVNTAVHSIRRKKVLDYYTLEVIKDILNKAEE